MSLRKEKRDEKGDCVKTACSGYAGRSVADCGKSSNVSDAIYNIGEKIADEVEQNSPATVEQRENTDFRNAYWGDTVTEVKQYESERDYLGYSKDSAVYECELEGHQFSLIYSFEEDKLYQGIYSLEDTFDTADQYIEVMNTYKDLLTGEYGEPDPDASGIVQYEEGKIDAAGEGAALEAGYIDYLYEWTTDTTRIRLFLGAEDQEIQMIILYQDLNHISEDE